MGKKKKQKKNAKRVEKLRLACEKNPYVYKPWTEEEMDRYVKCISECGMQTPEIEGDKCISNDFAEDTSNDSFSHTSTSRNNNYKDYYRKEKSWSYWD